jgi:hypothetical protein
LAGSVNWIKPAAAKTLYPQGFNLSLSNVLGSAYTNPVPPGGPALELSAGILTLVNGNLSPTLTYNVGFNNANQLTNLDATPTNYLVIIINPTNGWLTVSFRPTGATTNTTGHGAVLQNQGKALGEFLGTNQSGAILLH